MPRRSSLAVKIATLLFSGSVASIAILHAASSGCDAAPSSGTKPAEPEATKTIAAPAEPEATSPTPPTPAPRTDDVPPPPAADPAAAPRYFGGSKSDSDVWGGIKDVQPPPPAPAKGKKTRRDAR